MSREGLKNFVHAIEHSAALRKDVTHAKTPQDLVAIASAHGFAVCVQDLKDDLICSDIQSWFDRSWIHPAH